MEKDKLSAISGHTNLTMPLNKALESGAWTQSIIWSPRAPFRDFTQLELNEEEAVQDERHPGTLTFSIRLNAMITYIHYSRFETQEASSNRKCHYQR